MKKHYIALDFDGTICEHTFPEIGGLKSDVLLKVFARMDTLFRQGIMPILILHTCREDHEERAYLTEAVDFCIKNDIPITYINENPEVSFGGRKIYADEYWDDRAYNPLTS